MFTDPSEVPDDIKKYVFKRDSEQLDADPCTLCAPCDCCESACILSLYLARFCCCSNKRYAGLENYDIKSCAEQVKKDFGKVDILVHSLANGPEVTRPLLDTSRNG